MVSLDSIKFELPIDVISFNTNGSNCISRETKKGGKVVSNTHSYSSLDFGLNKISYNEMTGKVVSSMSAKLLKDNYSKGISLNTIEQLCSEINKHKVIDLCPSVLLEYGQFRTLDVCSNVELENTNQSISGVIGYGCMNSIYNVQHFNRKKGSSYVATKQVSTYKRRQTGYEKLKELIASDFIKHNPKYAKQFTKNTLRVESNIVNFKEMKRQFKVLDNNVGAILGSVENVNYNVFSEIISKGKQLELSGLVVSKAENVRLDDVIKSVGWIQTFNEFNNDLSAVKQWIKASFKRTSHNDYYKKAEKHYKEFNEIHLTKTVKLINEIESKLLAVA